MVEDVPHVISGPEGPVADPLVEALIAQEGHELFDYLTSIRERRCANCGDTASVVRFSLEGREREFLCRSCGRFA
jgi:hypothetical protein